MARKTISELHKPGASKDALASTEESGDFEIVSIDDLKVDMAYQRPLSMGLVQEISRNWDMAAAGTITVSRRKNGEEYIVNGQHRTAGAKLAGEEEICAQVFNGLTQSQEATLRLKHNVSRADTAHERFRGELAAKMPRAIAIREIVENHGSVVNTKPGDGKRGINAISALERLYGRDEGVSLSIVLEFLVDTFGDAEGAHATSSLLRSVEWLIANHDDEMNRGRMTSRLGEAGVADIERMARSHKAAMGGAMWINYYRTFIEVYNKRLPETGRLEWVASSSRTLRNS